MPVEHRQLRIDGTENGRRQISINSCHCPCESEQFGDTKYSFVLRRVWDAFSQDLSLVELQLIVQQIRHDHNVDLVYMGCGKTDQRHPYSRQYRFQWIA